jgi:hypothetical protein
MPRNFKINSAFIETWHPRYDLSESDEPEYQSLVAQIHKELVLTGSLSEETFVRVLDWKAPRVKGIARLKGFAFYERGIAEAVLADKGEKLEVLCRLYGIGAPSWVYGNVVYCRTSNFNVGWSLSLAPRQRRV